MKNFSIKHGFRIKTNKYTSLFCLFFDNLFPVSHNIFIIRLAPTKDDGKELYSLLELGKILENRPVAKDIYEMVLQVPEIAKEARPGQFVNLRLSDKLDPLDRKSVV